MRGEWRRSWTLQDKTRRRHRHRSSNNFLACSIDARDDSGGAVRSFAFFAAPKHNCNPHQHCHIFAELLTDSSRPIAFAPSSAALSSSVHALFTASSVYPRLGLVFRHLRSAFKYLDTPASMFLRTCQRRAANASSWSSRPLSSSLAMPLRARIMQSPRQVRQTLRAHTPLVANTHLAVCHRL